MPRRVAIVGMYLESNRYSAVVAGDRFHCMYGPDITHDARSAAPGMLKEGLGFFSGMDASDDWEPVPISMVNGGAGGPADDKFIAGEIERIRQRLAEQLPVDGVYILNHGAMTTTTDDDPDGALYETVRETVGADVPVVATVDLHANMSARMVESADVIVSYRTDPHVDQYACGEEAAQVLQEMFDGLRPVVRHIRVPIVAPNVSLLTDDGPYGDLIDHGQRRMGNKILNVSVVAGFAYGDTTTNGLHVIVTARDDANAAASLCRELAQMAWDIRHRFLWNLSSVEDAVTAAKEAGENSQVKPVLLADLGDNIGAGGPGNTLWLLEALLGSEVNDVLIGSFFDPELVETATDVGVGGRFNAVFHGDNWERSSCELAVADVHVRRLHKGRFNITQGPLKGMPVNGGAMCLLSAGGVSVLVTSRRPIVWPDPALLQEMDVELDHIRTLVLKCRSSYRAVFGPWFDSDRMIEVDTLGRTSPVLTRHDWKRIPRPSYPIDSDFAWTVPGIYG